MRVVGATLGVWLCVWIGWSVWIEGTVCGVSECVDLGLCTDVDLSVVMWVVVTCGLQSVKDRVQVC